MSSIVLPDGQEVVKGTRIQVKGARAHLACLSGSQPKFGATFVDVTGIFRHIRGDDPSNPKEIDLHIIPDKGIDPGYASSLCEKCGDLENIVPFYPGFKVEIVS